MSRKSAPEFLIPDNAPIENALKRPKPGEISGNDVLFYFNSVENADFLTLMVVEECFLRAYEPEIRT